MPPRQSERQFGKFRELWKRVKVIELSVRPLLVRVGEQVLNQRPVNA